MNFNNMLFTPNQLETGHKPTDGARSDDQVQIQEIFIGDNEG